MIPFDWKRELSRHDHRVVLSGQPVAIHCHHYNINLHKTLEDTLGAEGTQLIYQSAEEAIYYGIQELLSQYSEIRTVKSKLEMAAIMYQNCGLGVIHPQKIDVTGGVIISPSSHHVTGWLAKHGRRNTPGCHFSCGWIAGMMAAIHEKPVGYYRVTETRCKTMREPECVFDIRLSKTNKPTSCLSFGPSAALHPPAHIPICTGGCALQTNQNPSQSSGFICFRQPKGQIE